MVSMELVLESLTKLSHKCYAIGDININLLSTNGDYVSNLSNLFHSYMFFPVINKPTRFTNTSATIIDHFWSNDPNYLSSGILFSNISDHFPIFNSFILNNQTQRK